MFVGSVDAGDTSYTYLIGFPLSISKVTMYVDNARYQSGKTLIGAVIALTGILVVTLTIYSYRTFAAVWKRNMEERAVCGGARRRSADGIPARERDAAIA